MTIDEAHKIANKLRIDWEKFEEDYLDNSWPGVRTVLLRHSGGHCLFLQPQPDGKVFFCRVHKFKPESCIQWNADLDKKDCREGLKKYWNLGVDAEGEISGDQKDISAFHDLVERLKH
jgi:hypothetical protein